MICAGKKKQRKKADIDALLASMGESPADGESQPAASDAGDPKDKPKEKKKKKERKPASDVDALLAQLEGSAAPEEPESAASPDTSAQLEPDAQQTLPEASKSDEARRKKKAAAKGADEDIDALLAEIGGDSSVRQPEQHADDSMTAAEVPEQAPPANEPAAQPPPAAQTQSKKSKKKGKQVTLSIPLVFMALLKLCKRLARPV